MEANTDALALADGLLRLTCCFRQFHPKVPSGNAVPPESFLFRTENNEACVRIFNSFNILICCQLHEISK